MKTFNCLNKSLLILSLFLLLSLLITPSASADVRQITDNTVRDAFADIDGNNIVWFRDEGDLEIYLYNILTQTTTQITDNEVTDSSPEIENGKIVWGSFVNNSWELFLYDIATATMSQISENDVDNSSNAFISNGKIVWTGHIGTGSEIFLYDIASGTTTTVVNDTAPTSNGLDFEGGLIAWQGDDGNDYEIYLYDIATATIKQITDNTYNDEAPNTSDGKVTWIATSEAMAPEVYYYDSTTEVTTRVTNNEVIDRNALIDDGKIVWVESNINQTNSEIFLYNTATAVTTQLTNTPASEFRPEVKDGKVAWLAPDNAPFTSVYVYDIATGTTSKIGTRANFREAPSISGENVIWIGQDETTPDTEVFLWAESLQNFNTPEGTNVEYSDNGVQLTFSNVTAGGNTTITSSNQGNQPPAGFKIGAPPTYFSISTTATFTGTVEVCIDYSTLNTNGNENNFKLMHFEPGVGWVDTTTSLDTVNNIICGDTTSFSDFAVMAAPTIPDLISTVQSMNLQQGITNSLDAKLSAAQEALTATNNGQAATAVNKLNAFINEVEAQRGNKLTNAQADELHAFATNLIKIIQGQNTF